MNFNNLSMFLKILKFGRLITHYIIYIIYMLYCIYSKPPVTAFFEACMYIDLVLVDTCTSTFNLSAGSNRSVPDGKIH